jgi:hypothetical protein
MKRTFLKDALTNTPETSVKVNTQLHQDIMRAVKLAEPLSRKPRFNSVVPAWGAAVFALLVSAVFFYPSRTATVLPVSTPGQALSQYQNPGTSLEQLADSLLSLSTNAPVPEKELRKELERLKSDLERFDFRS